MDGTLTITNDDLPGLLALLLLQRRTPVVQTGGAIR